MPNNTMNTAKAEALREIVQRIEIASRLLAHYSEIWDGVEEYGENLADLDQASYELEQFIRKLK